MSIHYYHQNENAKAGDTVTFEFLDNATGVIKHFETDSNGKSWVVVMLESGAKMRGPASDLWKEHSL